MKMLRFAAVICVLLCFVATGCAKMKENNELAKKLEPELKPIADQVWKDMIAGDYAAVTAYFDAQMKAGLPQDTLASTMKSLTEKFGPLQSVEFQGVAIKDQFAVVFHRVKFEKKTLVGKVVFPIDGEKKVTGFWIN